jgi:hypothetical protein
MKYATALAAAGLFALASSAFAAEPKMPEPGLYEITYGLVTGQPAQTAQICLQTPAPPGTLGQWHGVQFRPDKPKPLAQWGGYYGYIGNVKFFGMVQLPEGGHPGQNFWEAELIEVAPATPKPGWSGTWTYWNNVGISNPKPASLSVAMNRTADCK